MIFLESTEKGDLNIKKKVLRQLLDKLSQKSSNINIIRGLMR